MKSALEIWDNVPYSDDKNEVNKKQWISKDEVERALSNIWLMRRDEDYIQFQEKIKNSIRGELGLK